VGDPEWPADHRRVGVGLGVLLCSAAAPPTWP